MKAHEWTMLVLFGSGLVMVFIAITILLTTHMASTPLCDTARGLGIAGFVLLGLTLGMRGQSREPPPGRDM